MVLLSDECNDETTRVVLDEIWVLFVHHDVESPLLLRVKQSCVKFCPSCRPVKLLNGSKSLLWTISKNIHYIKLSLLI